MTILISEYLYVRYISSYINPPGSNLHMIGRYFLILSASISFPTFVMISIGRNILTQSFETSLADDSLIKAKRAAIRPYARVRRTETEACKAPRKDTRRGADDILNTQLLYNLS